MPTTTQRQQPLPWLIGTELARFRNEVRPKMSMQQASAASGIGKPKIAQLETGRQLASPEDIERLLTVYGGTTRTISRLSNLASRTLEANWWEPWAPVVMPWFANFLTLEGLSERVFTHEVAVIPGLLQTEDHSLALAKRGNYRVRADHTRRLIQLRIARSARLRHPDRPLRLHAVIPEWILDLPVGSDEVQIGQLDHLIAMAERPTVTLQVLRSKDCAEPCLGPPFTYFNVDGSTQCGYLELLGDATYVHDHDKLASYAVNMDDLQRVALDPDHSVDLIQHKLKRWGMSR